MTDESLLYEIMLDDYITGLTWLANSSLCYATTAGGTMYGMKPEEGENIFKVDAHKNGVLALAVSPREGKIVTGGQDGLAKLWGCANGNLLKEIKAKHWVDAIAWSPDGNFFAINAGKSFILFDQEGNEITRSDPHESTIAALAWKADSEQLATASYGGVRIYNMPKFDRYEKLEWKNSLISLTWSPDGRFIMAGTQDNTIHIWQMDSVDKHDMAMQGYSNKVRALAWDESGKNLATNCGLNIVIWNTDRKNGPEKTKPVVLVGHKAKVMTLDYQVGEGMLASGDESGMLFTWVNRLGKYKLMTSCKLNGAVCKTTWNSDGSRLAAGTSTGHIVVFDC